MGYIAADDILKAREMDLMTYLRNYEPQELVRVSGNTYCTREHESLRISNGKWYWFSHDIGGKSALDYLIKVKDYSFIDAVKTILGNAAVKEPIPYYQKEKVNRDLLMPKLDEDTSQVEKYLYSRGIHPAVTLYCIEKKLLYQTAEYHNLSVLDELFERLEAKNPEHIALKYYRAYHSGSAKTLKSIQISLVSRLEKFNLDSLAGITQTDEMDLGEIGERKTAVFAVIPDNDSSFNFIVGMLYTQLFQQLYYQADSVHGGRLPVHGHFVMDEFANVALPDEFDKLLSTMRSREISVSIIIQNLAQLKALFEKQWESIVGNCDEFLYLGGNEQSTHEYVSKLLGKETIDTNTYGRSRGRNGSYSTNYQLTGRELMTPDEVRMLDNQYALLFIRGERPVQDFKYDILHHPNVRETTDGGAPAFTHGEDTRSIAAMSFVFDKNVVKQAQEIKPELHDFELLSEEELQEKFDKKEKEEHEKHQS